MTKTTRILIAINALALIALGFAAGYLIGNTGSTTTNTVIIGPEAPPRRTALFTGTADFRFAPDQPSSYGPTTA